MDKISEEKVKTKASPKDAGFDWFGLAIELGSYVLQGACMAAGGIAVTESYHGLSKPRSPDLMAQNVMPIKRSSAL